MVHLPIDNMTEMRSAPAAPREIRVSRYTNVSIFICQKSRNGKLGIIGILIFINKDKPEFILIHLKNIRMFLKEFYSLNQKIVKIQGIICLKKGLVFCINLGNGTIVITRSCRGEGFWSDKFIFCITNGTYDG